MFSIFTHVMKPVRDTNSEPGLPMANQESTDTFTKKLICDIQRNTRDYCDRACNLY